MSTAARHAPVGRAAGRPALVRVQNVPAAHPYVVQALGVSPGAASREAGIELLPDPPVPGAGPGQWWPSPVLDPDWLLAHRAEVDLVHVHFGVEHRTPAQIAEWTDLLARLGLPLVVTVHDLQLPHAVDQADHRARMVHLVTAADAVLTLTEGAAAEVRDLTGRQAVVVPHPRMEASHTIRAAVRPPRPSGPVVVGVHLKSLRANAGRVDLLEALRTAARALGPEQCRLEVTVHDEVVRPGPRRAPDVAAWVEAVEAGRGIEGDELVVHRIAPLDDTAFTAYLMGLDVSVLPHRWGTHSGWVEQCHDLGVVPVAPRVGHVQEQGVEHLYRWEGERPGARSLEQALTGAIAQARRGRTAEAAAAWDEHRTAQDSRSHELHARLYRELLSDHRAREAS